MAIIIGLNDSGKILKSANLFKESNGIQVLTQVYTVTQSGLANHTPNYLDPHPDFPTMAVESISTSNLSGDLAEIQIQYVGIMGDGADRYITSPSAQIPNQPTLETIAYPKPNYTLSAAQSGTYIHFPFVVNLQFLDAQTATRLKTLTSIFSPNQASRIPQSFRGLNLPNSTVAPYVQTTGVGGAFYYFGVVCRSLNIVKRGYFNIVNVIFSDSFASRAGTDK